MTGLELLQALRAAEWTVPFGFVTSESSDAIQESAFASGAAFLIAKPFSGEELRAKIEAFLAGSTVARAAGATATADRAGAVAELLEGLLRKPVQVQCVDRGPARTEARWTANYVDDAGATTAFCVVETTIASGMSAALTLMSPATAKEWASSGTLPDVLSEGFHEVTNVLARIVRSDIARCVLGKIAGYSAGEKLPDAAQISAAASSEHFRVTLEPYGDGLMTLVTL
jgi:CheY-like chemotaxis protein